MGGCEFYASAPRGTRPQNVSRGTSDLVAPQQKPSRATIRRPARPNPMISLARYAALLEPREMRQMFAASMLGRLPIGITGLAILLLVQSASGSFALAGTATGC